jgi:DNA-binding transcriptional LysR family regulator
MHPQDLSEHRLIGYVDDLLYSPALAYLGEFWTKWQSRIEISSATGRMEAAVAGAGIAILHDYLAAGRPDLTLVLPQMRAVRTYWTVLHESMRDVARIRACSAFLTELVQNGRVQFERRE